MNNTLFTLSRELTAEAADLIPYTGFIGLQCGESNGNPLFALPYKRENIGNVFLPALHGGMLGGFIESCAVLFLYRQAGLAELPKMIDFSLDYLRSGKPEITYARCSLTRQGSRIANVAVEAWQSDSAKPIVVARCHFQMPAAQ